jgi:hypothetical protein
MWLCQNNAGTLHTLNFYSHFFTYITCLARSAASPLLPLDIIRLICRCMNIDLNSVDMGGSAHSFLSPSHYPPSRTLATRDTLLPPGLTLPQPPLTPSCRTAHCSCFCTSMTRWKLTTTRTGTHQFGPRPNCYESL